MGDVIVMNTGAVDVEIGGRILAPGSNRVPVEEVRLWIGLGLYDRASGRKSIAFDLTSCAVETASETAEPVATAAPQSEPVAAEPVAAPPVVEHRPAFGRGSVLLAGVIAGLVGEVARSLIAMVTS